MDPISLEDLALLEVLKLVDQGLPLDASDTQFEERLHDTGLIVEDDGKLRLTSAGIELCKSLQHRVAAHVQAEKILKKRDQPSAGV